MTENSQTNMRGVLRLLMWVAIFWLAYGLIDLVAVLIPMYQSR